METGSGKATSFILCRGLGENSGVRKAVALLLKDGSHSWKLLVSSTKYHSALLLLKFILPDFGLTKVAVEAEALVSKSLIKLVQ